MDAHSFLLALTIVLGAAALTTVIFQRLRQPVVLGYILAGFILGPNVPIPIVADRQIVHTLSELGVILLMFSLGLEFSLGKLVKLGVGASLTALLETSLMIWLGFVTGRALGWTTLESLFTGALIAISSTTIIAKAFDEQRVRGPLRELVVGILIAEDLIAILLMATLTAVAGGTGLSALDMAKTSGKLFGFLGHLGGAIAADVFAQLVELGRDLALLTRERASRRLHLSRHLLLTHPRQQALGLRVDGALLLRHVLKLLQHLGETGRRR